MLYLREIKRLKISKVGFRCVCVLNSPLPVVEGGGGRLYELLGGGVQLGPKNLLPWPDIVKLPYILILYTGPNFLKPSLF